MGVQNFISNFAFIVAPWFLVIMTNPDWFRNQIDGAKFLALMVCIATIDLGANQGAQTLVMMRAFDAFIPLVASGVAIYAISKFPITEEMARRTRQELERRRGGGAAAAS